jgi:hypothetical protein
MPSPSPTRYLPRAVVALFVVALGGAAVSSSFHPERRAPSLSRMTEEADLACRAHPTTRVCAGRRVTAAPALSLFDHARSELEHARELARSGLHAEARVSLAQVVHDADRAERGGRLLDQLVATRLYDGSLDLVDAHRDVFDSAFVREVFRGVALPSGRRALEVDTIDVSRAAAKAVDETPYSLRGLVSSVVPWTLEEMTASRRAMAPAAEAGDVPACQRATRRLLPPLLVPSVEHDKVLCEAAGRFARTAKRIERERERAGGARPVHFR